MGLKVGGSMVDNPGMTNAGKAFAEKFKELPAEEREDIERQLKQTNEKYIPRIKAGVDEAMRLANKGFSVPQALMPEGKSSAEVLEEIAELQRKQVAQNRGTTILALVAIGVSIVSAVFAGLTLWTR